MKLQVYFVLILIITAALFSCNREREAKPPEKGKESTTALSKKKNPFNNPRKKISLNKEETGKKTTPTAKNTPPGYESVRFIAAGEASFIFPKDFKLDSLEGLIDARGETSRILKRLIPFLIAMEKGKVDNDLIESEVRSDLSSTLKFHFERGNIPVSYRIGEVNKNGEGKASVNLRLFSSVGSSEGEIYLIKKDKVWYIEGVQIDLNRLSVKEKGEKKKFDPSPFNWMIEEM